MRLAEWRKAEGLTQAELAEKLGVSQPYVSAIERWPNNAIPAKLVMMKIVELSAGDVLPNDFYPIDAALAKIAPHSVAA